MYDIRWFVDGQEFVGRFDNENDARNKYDELINNRKCDFVELVFVIGNWCAETD